jgi:hypothetical protein
MNNWRDDLLKKSQELQIKKEVTNGQNQTRKLPASRVNSSRSSNSVGSSERTSSISQSIDSRSSDLLSGKIHTEINNVQGKEAKVMITREAALDDLEKLEQETTDSVGKVVVKVAKVIVKILATIRSNQLLTDSEKVAIRQAKVERKQATVPKV